MESPQFPARRGGGSIFGVPSGDWTTLLSVYVSGNLLTLLVVFLLYLLYQFIGSYIALLFHSLLLAEVLQVPKQFISRKCGGRLSHSLVASFVVFGILFLVAFILLMLALLSFLDLRGLYDAASQLVAGSVLTSKIEAWGLQTALEYVDLPKRFAMLEAEYNNTTWWPLVSESINWVSQHEPSSRTTNLTQSSQSMMDQLGDLYQSVQQMDETLVGRFKDFWERLQNTDEAGQFAMTSVAYFAQGSRFTMGFLLAFASSLVDCFFFVSLTIALLTSKKSVLEEFLGELLGDYVEDHVRQVVRGCILYPVFLCLGRLLYTVFAGIVLRVHFPYLLACLTFSQTMLPIVSTYPIIAALPWISILASSGALDWNLFQAVALFISQYYVLGKVEEAMAGRSVRTLPSWVTGISVVLGFERFGLQAFIFGPLVVSLVILCHNVLYDKLKSMHRTLPKQRPALRHTQSAYFEQTPSRSRARSVAVLFKDLKHLALNSDDGASGAPHNSPDDGTDADSDEDKKGEK
eukprot:TRINITY_DN110751_c0_g1_i1.p1 TRINITY_DN110751_c0_g1~~TRINITY_DN110751_c0_g1_i1.p1  ORF type:complete len:519 (+),score=60.15 TRINITY_DN110751_c0_g1_i1:90-1646(+)